MTPSGWRTRRSPPPRSAPGASLSRSRAKTDSGSAAVGLTLAVAGNTTYSGSLTGAGSLTKSGTGTQTLTGNNTFSGGTTISAGTLVLSGAGTLGSGTVSIGNGGTLLLAGSATTGTGNVSMSTGSIFDLGGGTLTLASNLTINGGTLQNGTLALPLLTSTSGTSTVSAALADPSGGTLAIAKSGSGTLNLTNDTSTFTGSTRYSLCISYQRPLISGLPDRRSTGVPARGLSLFIYRHLYQSVNSAQQRSAG